jgi:hypothetical protein
MSLYNDARDEIGRLAGSGRRAIAAGARSGLNQIKAGGWGGLFGMNHLRSIRGIQKNHQEWANALLKVNGGYSGLRGMSEAKLAPIKKQAEQLAVTALGDIGSEAWKFASGHGYTGMGRAGAIGARAGMIYGALQVADFLNPFGFGSIRD